MKTRLLIIIWMLSVGFSGITFAEQPTNCTFGDKSTPLENIFEKDLAVKAFTEKHQNATRNIAANESGSLKNQLVLQAQNDNIKETLEIKFNTDTKGCYIPASYHYSYNDGILDVTIRNSVANFTEIMNLIKSNNKSIDDFYPDDCDFVDLDVAITSGKVFGACKGTTSKFIILLIDAPSNGILEVDIPIQMVYSLPSTDCKPTGDFLVMLDNEETRYEIMPTAIGNLVKVEFAEGFHKIQIMGTVILPDPSPAQYCGIVEGYLDKKYLAPLDQTDNGVVFEFIRCNEDLVLIQKYDGSPACVKPQTVQTLVERGWNLVKSALTNNILENNCGKFYTAPSQNNLNTVPVLLMDSNSTACARLTFTIGYDYSDASWPRIAVFPPLLDIGNYNYTSHGIIFGVGPGKDYTNSFQITVEPQIVDLANFSIGSNFTVTYMIKPLPNATGFYDHFIPRLVCERYPLAVGYDTDQINYSNFSYIYPLNPPCGSGPYGLAVVEISGMSYKDVGLPPRP